VLWFIDEVNASLDSLTKSSTTIALINELNIDDLLFRYGVRINPQLVQDVQCNLIPVNVALAGNSPDFKPAPWLFSPLLTPPSTHPITRNLNMIKTEFPCNIDTIGARKGIKKIVLLRSSEYSRVVTAPLMISLDEIRETPKQEEFNTPYLPIAVLLEGKFETAFKNRPVNKLVPDTVLTVKDQSVPTAMLIVADGDIIRNDIRVTPRGVMISPLGYDRFTQRTYGNKDFIINALHYLTGKSGLINLRSRELSLRLLDKEKIKDHHTRWVLVNTVLPLLLIIIAGIIYNALRRKKYTERIE
jgi:ABC-2 type transport system permease protein